MTASNLCLCLSLSLPLLFSFSPFLSDLLFVSKDHPPIYLKSNHNGIGFSNLLNLDRNVLSLRFPQNNIGGSCYLPPNIKPRSINYTQSMLHEYWTVFSLTDQRVHSVLPEEKNHNRYTADVQT